MKVHKTVAKFLLARIGRVLGPHLSVAVIRFILTRLRLPGRLSEFLRWPITTHMLPANYTEDVMLRNGIVMRVGLDDGINRRLLYYSRHFELCWEPQTARLASQLVNGREVVIIGGAHIGYHALLMAHKLKKTGGQIHAFEPVSKFFERLEASKELNRFQHLYCIRRVLSDVSERVVKVYVSSSWPSVFAWEKDADLRHEEVPCIALDDYIEQQGISKVALLMLDVEGAEYNVFLGADRLISRADAPDIVFETNPPMLARLGLEEANLFRHLDARGYDLFAIRDEYMSGNESLLHAARTPVELLPILNTRWDEFSKMKWFNVYATKDVRKLDKLDVVVQSAAQRVPELN